MRLLVSLSTVLFVATGLSCSRPNYSSNVYRACGADPRNKEIVLGVGDVVSINVWDQKDLNTEATIRPDGTITMPLAGDIKALGQTPTQLRERIRAALEKFLKLGGSNEITVAVKAWKSYRFTVQGEVGKPGVYSSDEWMNVSDALALAGGPTRFADRSGLVLMRKDQRAECQRIALHFDDLASGKRTDMNLWVLPGDVLYMP
jgi:polysaccharide biosynthesis/export protein